MSTEHVTFPKPSRLDRDVAKFQRRTLRDKVKTAETRKAQRAWSELSAKVCARDGNTCRVCSCQTTKAGVGNPKWWGAAHHLIYRSANGPSVLENLVWLCRSCHDAEHRHELRLTGTSSDLRIAR